MDQIWLAGYSLIRIIAEHSFFSQDPFSYPVHEKILKSVYFLPGLKSSPWRKPLSSLAWTIHCRRLLIGFSNSTLVLIQFILHIIARVFLSKFTSDHVALYLKPFNGFTLSLIWLITCCIVWPCLSFQTFLLPLCPQSLYLSHTGLLLVLQTFQAPLHLRTFA